MTSKATACCDLYIQRLLRFEILRQKLFGCGTRKGYGIANLFPRQQCPGCIVKPKIASWASAKGMFEIEFPIKYISTSAELKGIITQKRKLKAPLNYEVLSRPLSQTSTVPSTTHLVGTKEQCPNICKDPFIWQRERHENTPICMQTLGSGSIHVQESMTGFGDCQSKAQKRNLQQCKRQLLRSMKISKIILSKTWNIYDNDNPNILPAMKLIDIRQHDDNVILASTTADFLPHFSTGKTTIVSFLL